MVHGEVVYRGFDDLRAYVLVDLEVNTVDIYGQLSVFVPVVFSFLSDIIPGIILRAGLWNAF
jgi:hypothetical protein